MVFDDGYHLPFFVTDPWPLELPNSPWARCKEIVITVDNCVTFIICGLTRQFLDKLLTKLNGKLSKTKPPGISIIGSDVHYLSSEFMMSISFWRGVPRSQEIVDLTLDILIFESRHRGDDSKRLTENLKGQVASAPLSDVYREILELVLRQRAFMELSRCNNPANWYQGSALMIDVDPRQNTAYSSPRARCLIESENAAARLRFQYLAGDHLPLSVEIESFG